MILLTVIALLINNQQTQALRLFTSSFAIAANNKRRLLHGRPNCRGVELKQQHSLPVSSSSTRFSSASLSLNMQQDSQQLTAVNEEFHGDKKEPVFFGNPEKMIEAKFERCMKSPNVPLLRDFQSYARHLPVRTADLVLYKLDYLVRPEALETLSANIGNRSSLMNGKEVKYLCAPTASGKSASVLPAFLVNEKATHYFYIPFHNNNDRYFQCEPFAFETNDLFIAEFQGAAFMVDCVKRLLDDPFEKQTRVEITKPEALYQNYSEMLQNYLDDKLGKNAVVWFHVDEHGKMIDRKYNAEAAAAFSRGAMSVLTLPNTRVVASYTKAPTEIPAAMMSPNVSRIALVLPPLDLTQVMKRVPELYLNEELISDQDQRRLLASLRFRIAMRVGYYPISYLHIRGDDKVEELVICALINSLSLSLSLVYRLLTC